MWHFLNADFSRLEWFSTAVRDRNYECSVVARTFGPYVGRKCSRLVCGQGVRLGYITILVLVPRFLRIVSFITCTCGSYGSFRGTRNSNASRTSKKKSESKVAEGRKKEKKKERGRARIIGVIEAWIYDMDCDNLDRPTWAYNVLKSVKSIVTPPFHAMNFTRSEISRLFRGM